MGRRSMVVNDNLLTTLMVRRNGTKRNERNDSFSSYCELAFTDYNGTLGMQDIWTKRYIQY